MSRVEFVILYGWRTSLRSGILFPQELFVTLCSHGIGVSCLWVSRTGVCSVKVLHRGYFYILKTTTTASTMRTFACEGLSLARPPRGEDKR